MSESVATRLRKLRHAAGDPPQREVAERAGFAYRSLQNWESESARVPIVPSWRNAIKLARYYATTPEYVLYGIDGAAPSRAEMSEVLGRLDALIDVLSDLTAGLGSDRLAGLRDVQARAGVHSTGHRTELQEVVF